MSSSELRILENVEMPAFQVIWALKYILTIPHDWLVKRVFVYIIEKRSYLCALLLNLTSINNYLKDRDGTCSFYKNPLSGFRGQLREENKCLEAETWVDL